MATTVYDSVTIALQDGKEVTLVPLALGRLRKFMDAWKKFTDIKEEDEAFDIYVNCCGISLAKQLSDTFEKPVGDDGTLSADYREYLEDTLDMDTIFKILEVCGGLKLNDPKLLESLEA
jgi:hypothetical protein